MKDKEVKALVVRMLAEVGRRRDDYREKFKKELKNIKKDQSELKNTITEMKSMLDGRNSRLGSIDKCISDLGNRIMEITQSEEHKEKQIKMRKLKGPLKQHQVYSHSPYRGSRRRK